MTAALRAPFPWFGGKSRAAALVWRAFGDVPNYVEPFAGSLAVLLGRPTAPRNETVNDIDAFLSNFWRSLKAAPADVAHHADWPVIEVDLHAWHRWLVTEGLRTLREGLRNDPEFFDAKIAGRWCWGLCQWIGGGWCVPPEWRDTRVRGIGEPRPSAVPNGINGITVGRTNAGQAARGVLTVEKRPFLSNHGGGLGVHSKGLAFAAHENTRPAMKLSGVHAKRPRLGGGSRGIDAALKQQIPDLSGDGSTGRGIHASALTKKAMKADRGSMSRLIGPREAILAWMEALAARLRRVRVCTGDWMRVMGPAVTTCIGTTGVFLDPPYSAEAGRDSRLYGHDDLTVAHAVREWALEHGDDRKLRIALCGYEGEHAMPKGWQCVAWKATGGYGSARKRGTNANAGRERIWFSPHCLPLEVRPPPAEQRHLFAQTTEVA